MYFAQRPALHGQELETPRHEFKHLADKCRHIVNVKKYQEIVNNRIIFVLCHTGTEIRNALLWGHTGGEAHGHNNHHRQAKLYLQGEAFTMWWHFLVFTMC